MSKRDHSIWFPRAHQSPSSGLTEEHFREIATYLYQVRVSQGLTVLDLAQRTSLSPMFIQAIENSDFKGLPEAWSKAACLQCYANALGIGEAQIPGGLPQRFSGR